MWLHRRCGFFFSFAYDAIEIHEAESHVRFSYLILVTIERDYVTASLVCGKKRCRLNDHPVIANLRWRCA